TARGVVCHFALPADVTARAWLAAAGMPSPILLPERESVLPHVLAAAAAMDAVIGDVPHPPASDEARALGVRWPVRVVANARDGVGEADLILAPLLATAPISRWLIGAEHVPLRASFRTPPAAPEHPPGAPPVVLVSMGATDPGGLTVPIVDALARV